MPRTSAFLLMLLLLALAGVAWVFLAGGDTFRDEVAPDDVDHVAVESGPAPLATEGTPALTGSRRASDPRKRRKPRWPVLPTNQIPRGAIEVLPVFEDETPVSARVVRVRLFREPSFYARSVGIPDYGTNVWRFDKVVVGWLKVIVTGDHILETTQRAQVTKGQTEEVTVVVSQGGAIAYEAELYSGERPERIALELRDPETKRPLSVYWQTRLPESHSSPRKATQVRIAAQGVAFSIPPGRWILHATSDEGEIDQVDLEVVAGETTQASIKLRK